MYSSHRMELICKRITSSSAPGVAAPPPPLLYSRRRPWRLRPSTWTAAPPLACIGAAASTLQQRQHRRGHNSIHALPSSSSSSNGETSSSIDESSSTSPSTTTTSSSVSVAGDGGPLLKTVVASAMTEQLYSYLLDHTREHPSLRRLREATAGMHGAHMQVSPEQGAFLALLAELTGARRALEVGVFTGYSALAVALALPDDGQLVALDKDEASMAVARAAWRDAGVEHRIDARLGPALDSLDAILAEPGAEGSFDFAFIDADKRAYPAYFERCLKLVRAGGLIAVDNVLFYGRVVDPQPGDKAALALHEFNAALLVDERVTVATVPVGDGVALCRKR